MELTGVIQEHMDLMFLLSEALSILDFIQAGAEYGLQVDGSI